MDGNHVAPVRLRAVPDRLSPSGAGDCPGVRVGLAVSHDFVRRATSVLLAGSTGLELVGETSSVAGALEMFARDHVDVLVLDRRLPDGSSPESIRQIRRIAPAVSIVVVAMASDSRVASEAIGAGAGGYVLKDTADCDLVGAVLDAADGHCYVSPVVTERIKAGTRTEQPELSSTQIAVLCLLARGHADEEIVRELRLTDAALDGFRAGIYRQLGLASRAELAHHALRHGLLSSGRSARAEGSGPA